MADESRISRRALLKLVATSAGAGMLPSGASASIVSNYPSNQWGTPGLYPGRVVAMQHAGSTIDFQYQTPAIQQMLRSGLMALTGADNYVTAWRQFVNRGDIVGIKVNPNANGDTMSSPAVIMEIIGGLILAGIEPKNIIVYERYAEILSWIAAWFPSWLQTASAAPAYSDDQTGITGYDANHYVDLPAVLLPWQNAANPAHTRSYAARFITGRVNKIINLAVLKEHNAAGVTFALKNLSHGFTNNVNRAHPGDAYYFTTYIPAVVSMPVIRYKAVLHIIDGIHGIYEGGPHGDPKYNWEHKTMYFSTDAVAVDRIGWRVIDDKRVAVGLPVTAESTAFMQPGPFCQPQYITAAGEAGLGEYRESFIDLRKTVLA